VKFLSEDVRVRFHELTIDQQLEWLKFESNLQDDDLTILFVDNSEGLEISIRIDRKLNKSG
jgi:hypothetical protein